MHDPMILSGWFYAGLTALAVVTGFIDAIAGGGGLLMMPALITTGLPPHVVLGTNKVQSICGTTMAAWRYRKAGLFSIAESWPKALASLAGAAAGAWLIQHMDAHVLKLVVPLLLMAVAIYTVVSPRMDDGDSRSRLSERQYLPVSGAIGFYDGFFGPGAGQFYTTSLVALRGFGLTRATGLTKFLNVASNFASAVVFAAGGQVLWLLGLCMGLGAIAGAWLGSHAATRFGARVIRPLLVAVSLGLTGRLVWGWFHP
ncbi:TSUP family transporter [Novosphingobium cyanobacteriorum]|uniref:Probable membrane transporter protein n=1 Tax=Novosphingobium cyanobacteriorum TaxID=3024215 RepID=A0ABT6CEZ8_9SPHN|nr:TSUP family transporter [Novosphingobium cyanobacteriorum]MDF8331665.1 TSUP family transporter [Novosphingobium cyanobacteriorum]